MALEIRQQSKQVQTLNMSPMLRQAIQILLCSRQELMETVQRELLENPLLEIREPDSLEIAEPSQTETRTPSLDAEDELPYSPNEIYDNTDWERGLIHYKISVPIGQVMAGRKLFGIREEDNTYNYVIESYAASERLP